jgi:lipopolysaccharide transport system permease protein
MSSPGENAQAVNEVIRKKNDCMSLTADQIKEPKVIPSPSTPGEHLPVAPRQPRVVISATRGFVALHLLEIWQFRDLFFALAARDVKIRYKQTVLGVFWVVLQPLLAAGIFSIVFGKIAKMPTDGVPVFIFSYAGLLGWGLFSNTLTRTSNCLIGNSHLISKVFFPRLILPLSTVGSVLIDFGVAAVILAIIMGLSSVAPAWPMLTVPIWIILLLSLSLGLGLWAAALTVSYRDVQYVMPVLIQFGMYVSPAAYSVLAIPEKYQTLYYLNPLAGLLDAFRWSLLGVVHEPQWWAVGYAAAISIAAMIFGALMFKKMERKFADVI